jgi:hypothetical protein
MGYMPEQKRITSQFLTCLKSLTRILVTTSTEGAVGAQATATNGNTDAPAPTSLPQDSAGGCNIGNDDTNINCDGNKNQQGLGASVRVPQTLFLLCLAIGLFGVMVFGDSTSICNVENDDDNANCSNNSIIYNPKEPDSTGQEGNRIALGCGIGTGVPTFIVTSLGILQWKRKGRLC